MLTLKIVSFKSHGAMRSRVRCRSAAVLGLGLLGLRCGFTDVGCDGVTSAPVMPEVADLRPLSTLLTTPHTVEAVPIDPVATFALGTFVGTLMGFISLFVVLTSFIRNLQTDELDGAKWGSSGGLVMPSFFFRGATDIYNNVRTGADEARRVFQETGRFEDIYLGIEERVEMGGEDKQNCVQLSFLHRSNACFCKRGMSGPPLRKLKRSKCYKA